MLTWYSQLAPCAEKIRVAYSTFEKVCTCHKGSTFVQIHMLLSSTSDKQLKKTSNWIYFKSNNSLIYLPNTQGLPSRYFKMYLFKNNVHPLNTYHNKRNTIALTFNRPVLVVTTIASQFLLSEFISDSFCTLLEGVMCMWVFSMFISKHQHLQALEDLDNTLSLGKWLVFIQICPLS